MFEDLAKYSRIAVTGPQRSGTTIAAKMIAEDTGYRFMDEKEFGTFNSERWRRLLQDEYGIVVQCPHMLKDAVDDPPTGVLIVLMRRPLDEIHASDERVQWQAEYNGNTTELRKFGLCEGDSARVKYDYWDNHDKDFPYLELPYERLAGHPLYVAQPLRQFFQMKQTRKW
jgi:hypothetical protein